MQDHAFENSFRLPPTDRYLYVNNDGLSRITVELNQQILQIIADPIRRDRAGNRQYMPLHGDISLDVGELLTEAENDVVLLVEGGSDAKAHIVFADVRFPTSSSALPQDFALYQNFPNPFNPSTTIEFTVPEGLSAGSVVELTVYNIFGQSVRSLVSETKQPGAYSAVWDGVDDSGIAVSSGVYFYRIRMANYSAIKRLLFIK